MNGKKIYVNVFREEENYTPVADRIVFMCPQEVIFYRDDTFKTCKNNGWNNVDADDLETLAISAENFAKAIRRRINREL